MSGILSIEDGTFINKLASIPIGEKYTRFDYDDGRSVAVGDLVYFDDPDAGMHVDQCPLVMGTEFIGYVKTVYSHDPDYGDRGPHPEVGTSNSLGRLDVSDSYVCIIPTDGPDGHRGHPLLRDAWGGTKIGAAKTMAENLHNHDEYDKRYSVERHGGWGAIGKEKAKEIRACSECQENEFGPNYTHGE